MMWSKVAAWSGWRHGVEWGHGVGGGMEWGIGGSGWRHGVGRVHVCGGVCGNSGAGLGEVVSAGLGEAVG